MRCESESRRRLKICGYSNYVKDLPVPGNGKIRLAEILLLIIIMKKILEKKKRLRLSHSAPDRQPASQQESDSLRTEKTNRVRTFYLSKFLPLESRQNAPVHTIQTAAAALVCSDGCRRKREQLAAVRGCSSLFNCPRAAFATFLACLGLDKRSSLLAGLLV